MRKPILCTIILGNIILGSALASWRAMADEPVPSGPPPSGPPPSGPQSAAPAQSGDSGAALYDRFCLPCHGTYGDGKGPGAPWLWPRPRDLTRGEYKWRTTPSGAPPTDSDLAATISYGVPGTSMHPFAATLDKAQIAALVRYIKAFAPDVFTRPAAPIQIAAPPAITQALMERGKAVYTELGCTACHGEGGKGNGPAAKSLRDADGHPAVPYDLTAEPLRRPSPATGIADVYKSLLTGLSGTPMPSYAGAAPDADLWAVAAYVDSIRLQFAGEYKRPRPTHVHPLAGELDRVSRAVKAGYWPGNGTDEELAVFGKTITLQGPPPASLAPAQSSLHADQCARCHAKQAREWQRSLHAAAASPGFMAQMQRADGNRGPAMESCQRCHAPLAEQLPRVRPGHHGDDDADRAFAPNPRFTGELRTQGISCAACHVRKWQRFGPARLPGSGLLALPGYPVTELALYERSDFCLGCHQLQPRNVVNGRPLLNTYREWLEGPYMRRGIQCQHCHMPSREHTWKGVHDPDTFRQGIAVDAIAERSAKTGTVRVRARLTNVGAGHYLPTTPTPAAWLTIELTDGGGRRIPGAYAEKRIGRHLRFAGRMQEIEDTRIPPGESVELAATWKGAIVANAVAVRVIVRVIPDDYYEGVYRARLKDKLTARERALYEEALRRAESAHYVALEQIIPLKR